ncbi:MAG: ABC transporter ATP-binding protein [Humidesulfovibrio sp.]|uniref:ABC transporter ATP-binding protein n=1 Tax=Humidesulfovibrio sp. TaxID=2910988 RepID=UPI002736F106|nr:ABC transporter ATP-binding protein [Humidesulfovibrio sp.]MDP2849372.1 ABC transporter ATP-binding protein [Humidesulfovibrio sp.]
MTAPTLCASAISKAFTTGKITNQVIQESTLEILPAELTLVVGPSGSGKSTMLSMLSGLLRPDAGRVLALGEDLWSLSEAEVDRFRLQHCGFVFQGFNLFGALTASENVILPMQYLGVHGAEARALAQAALDEVGLGPRSHLRPMELSGGEKQRVAIARALVKAPRLLFADEPTSALDSTNGAIVVELLKRIAREHGTTVLGVTHDPRLLSHADRVIQLEDGRITRDERPINSNVTH